MAAAKKGGTSVAKAKPTGEAKVRKERRKTAPKAESTTAEGAIRGLARAFDKDLPAEAHSGHYSPTARDGFQDRIVKAPDGDYHVDGHDWIFTISGHRLAQALRSEHAAILGNGVIEVPAPTNG